MMTFAVTKNGGQTMTVFEYREKHKHCKFCRHIMPGMFLYSCEAKRQIVFINKAKKCPLYEVSVRSAYNA